MCVFMNLDKIKSKFKAKTKEKNEINENKKDKSNNNINIIPFFVCFLLFHIVIKFLKK